MALKYSPSAGGFFDTDIHGDAIPDDAVDVTHERHRELMTAQAAGLVIRAGVDGAPVAQQPPPASPEQIAAARKVQIQADLKSIDDRKVRALTDALLNNDTSRLQSLETQAAALRLELAGLTT